MSVNSAAGQCNSCLVQDTRYALSYSKIHSGEDNILLSYNKIYSEEDNTLLHIIFNRIHSEEDNIIL